MSNITKKLENLLEIFENMTVEEYETLYKDVKSNLYDNDVPILTMLKKIRKINDSQEGGLEHDN